MHRHGHWLGREARHWRSSTSSQSSVHRSKGVLRFLSVQANASSATEGLSCPAMMSPALLLPGASGAQPGATPESLSPCARPAPVVMGPSQGPQVHFPPCLSGWLPLMTASPSPPCLSRPPSKLCQIILKANDKPRSSLSQTPPISLRPRSPAMPRPSQWCRGSHASGLQHYSRCNQHVFFLCVHSKLHFVHIMHSTPHALSWICLKSFLIMLHEHASTSTWLNSSNWLVRNIDASLGLCKHLKSTLKYKQPRSN